MVGLVGRLLDRVGHVCKVELKVAADRTFALTRKMNSGNSGHFGNAWDVGNVGEIRAASVDQIPRTARGNKSGTSLRTLKRCVAGAVAVK